MRNKKNSRPSKKEETRPSSRSKRRAADTIKEKRKVRYHPGTVALREIKKYQKEQKRLSAKVPFIRKVRAILSSLDSEIRLKEATIEAFREAAEAYMTDILSDANLCAIHAKRQTVMTKDLLLATKIRGDELRY
ncbi:unnamed protein product [Moneuplotes crassus]|uniref:Core Histone H2A/H2B/H3 domain-containing protein n=1 Tax=Euplotes crassus TaxID=5936 RepID=A0AAD1Y0N5_EUPCR|nr:unnamed protein product [Moneuplotes crassus]